MASPAVLFTALAWSFLHRT